MTAKIGDARDKDGFFQWLLNYGTREERDTFLNGEPMPPWSWREKEVDKYHKAQKEWERFLKELHDKYEKYKKEPYKKEKKR